MSLTFSLLTIFLCMHDLNGSKRVTKVMKQYVSKAEERAMWNGRQKLFRRAPVLQLLWALASFVPLTHFQHHIFLCKVFTVKSYQRLLEVCLTTVSLTWTSTKFPLWRRLLRVPRVWSSISEATFCSNVGHPRNQRPEKRNKRPLCVN